jgi:hypothetical protein
LRIIPDTVLRAKLLRARLASPVQSPKGPQSKKYPSIIRLHPNGDAPQHQLVTRSPRLAGRPHVTGKPTIEQMEALIHRFRAVEGHVARELSLGIDNEIAELQQAVAAASPEEIDATIAALQEARAKKSNGARFVREEAFRLMQNENLPERRFLGLLAF